MKNIHKIGKELFITSDETAYPYAFHYQKEVLKIRAVGENSGELYHDKGFSYPDQCKKIILTTDKDLIADGVQAINDEFLEWFVKNPSCESVETQFFAKFHNNLYKIIIPKEEAKQDLEKEMFELEQELDIPSHLRWHNSKPKQETLEEFAKQEAIKQYSEDTFGNLIVRKSIEKGAKWQQERMYSEEDMLEFSEWVSDNDWVYLPSKGCWVNEEEEESEEKFTTKELFNKFKNK